MATTTTTGRQRLGREAGAAATRVVDVQRQAARALRLTATFLVAAAATAVLGVGTTTWLPLHLLLVGGALTAIVGATQLLAVTWSASPAPSDRLAAAQRRSLALLADADALAGTALAVWAADLVWRTATLAGTAGRGEIAQRRGRQYARTP